ncbi:uncharacterized protein LOC142342445 isoform X2 [Convolutriloba macropyga]|uniref:uncharacterized protein LOC142342445 isoform X2 n=1 Tax=Convolutriloba macropyga TaxID=536237 RepID=UPI003F528295
MISNKSIMKSNRPAPLNQHIYIPKSNCLNLHEMFCPISKQLKIACFCYTCLIRRAALKGNVRISEEALAKREDYCRCCKCIERYKEDGALTFIEDNQFRDPDKRRSTSLRSGVYHGREPLLDGHHDEYPGEKQDSPVYHLTTRGMVDGEESQESEYYASYYGEASQENYYGLAHVRDKGQSGATGTQSEEIFGQFNYTPYEPELDTRGRQTSRDEDVSDLYESDSEEVPTSRLLSSSNLNSTKKNQPTTKKTTTSKKSQVATAKMSSKMNKNSVQMSSKRGAAVETIRSRGDNWATSTHKKTAGTAAATQTSKKPKRSNATQTGNSRASHASQKGTNVSSKRDKLHKEHLQDIQEESYQGGYSTKYRSKGAERGGGGGEEEIGSDGDDGTMDEIRQQQEDSNTLAAKEFVPQHELRDHEAEVYNYNNRLSTMQDVSGDEEASDQGTLFNLRDDVINEEIDAPNSKQRKKLYLKYLKEKEGIKKKFNKSLEKTKNEEKRMQLREAYEGKRQKLKEKFMQKWLALGEYRNLT